MNALSLRPSVPKAISRARPVEAVAEVVAPDLDRDAERPVTIRIELVTASAAAPKPAPRSVPLLTFEGSGADHLPLTAATRSSAARAYAAHASAFAEPPRPGIVIRRRA